MELSKHSQQRFVMDIWSTPFIYTKVMHVSNWPCGQELNRFIIPRGPPRALDRKAVPLTKLTLVLPACQESVLNRRTKPISPNYHVATEDQGI